MRERYKKLLTTDEIIDVYNRYHNGESLEKIGQEIHVSEGCVRRCVRLMMNDLKFAEIERQRAMCVSRLGCNGCEHRSKRGKCKLIAKIERLSKDDRIDFNRGESKRDTRKSVENG